MFKLSTVTHKSLFIIPFTTVLLISSNANAEVYKWRDSKGIMQYSDNPPTDKKVKKASADDIVNSIQKKDLCVIPEQRLSQLTAKNKSQDKVETLGFFATEISSTTSTAAANFLNRFTGSNRAKLDAVVNATKEEDL